MNPNYNLSRFLDAQNQLYLTAFSEIKCGQKKSHWMWFIFPQIKGLGHSDTARHYAINDLDEAGSYLLHPVLGKHLIEISAELLKLQEKTATQIFGHPDDMKLRSCMTLFSKVENANPVFEEVLAKYFHAIPDNLTLAILKSD
jgi:uncharacterized protein (DUF1810 family)